MTWSNAFWFTCNVIADTVIEVIENTLYTLGVFGCIVGGAGLPVSYGLKWIIDGSYFGSMNTTAGISFGINSAQFGYNDTQLFSRYDQMSGSMKYNLIDYINPDYIRLASGICFTLGTGVKGAADIIKYWRLGREDKRYYKRRYKIDIGGPSFCEYSNVFAGSLFSSISYAAFTSTIIGTIFSCSGLIGSTQRFTYPSTQVNSTYDTVNTTDYQGPVLSTLIPLGYALTKNITFSFPIQALLPNISRIIPIIWPKNISVLIQTNLNGNLEGTANVTYGGGLSFINDDPNLASRIIPAISGPVGIAAYLMSNSIFRITNLQRNKRIYNAQQEKEQQILCSSINIL